MPKPRSSTSRRRREFFRKKYIETVVPLRVKVQIDRMEESFSDMLRYMERLEVDVYADLETKTTGTGLLTEITESPSADVGFWTNGANAYSSNDVYASCVVNNRTHEYWNYGFAIPPAASIFKVEIGIEFRCLATESVRLRLSRDGGATWTPWSDLFALLVEDMLWVNFTAGYADWSADDFSDANLRIQINFRKQAGAGCPEKEAWTAYLDWIPVRVTIAEWPVQSEEWPHYMAFAKRAFKFHYNFDQPTADNEVVQLIEEFVLRGLNREVLEQLTAIAKNVGELAKQEA